MERFVYALVDPETSKVRYVGLTTTGASRPQRQVRWPRMDKSHRATWVRALIARGKRPEWVALQYCSSDEDVSQAERFWISNFSARGFDLVNHMDGGFDGRPDAATRVRMRETHIKTHCKNGHEYTPANTMPGARPDTRRCRACNEAWIVAHAEDLSAAERARYAANPEPFKARSRARSRSHRESLNAQARARYTTEARRSRYLRSKGARL